MTSQSDGGRVSEHPGVRSAWDYSFFEAITNRRSRRVSLGSEVPGGPTKYKSGRPPVPLDEIEEAMLVLAATGITGILLADLPTQDDRGRDCGANTLISFKGLAYPSPCASHDTRLIYWNDEATYIVKPELVTAEKVREYVDLDDREKLLRAFRACRVKLFDGRPEYPHTYPTMLPFNIWSSDIAGSTIFLPVADVTFEFINVLLLMCGWADGGMYFIDDVHGNRPAGCERWAQEGLLNSRLAVPLSAMGNVSAIEAGFIMQNLVLAEQAMGLGGWIHAHPAALVLLGGTPLAKGLGFRFISPKVGRPTRGAGFGAAPSPVGLDGHLEPYCPPYYPNMDAAVDAVVATKFGPKGIFTSGSEEPSPFRGHNEFLAGMPPHSDKLVQCVKDICNYIYETFGKFPHHVDAVTTPGSWVQAHHLDLDFYDKFYQEGAYAEIQRDHMDIWHGAAAEAWRERALAGATA